ncbi:hypothetical protein ACOZE3_17170 [Streptomyces cinereoruber]|uniref:hypothetical protein n=1 Tax=Streptomyces cinereoruber TaxID=67260 RepID=UPI003BF5EFFA
MTCALDGAETAEALERYRRRAEGSLAGGLLLILAGALFAFRPGSAGIAAVLAWPVTFGVMFALVGAGSLVIARRMRAVLAAGEWSAHTAVPVARRLHSPAVVLGSPATGELWPLTVVAVRWRQDAAEPGPNGVLRWCGDPRTGGVLAHPDSGKLFWAKSVRGGAARRRVVRRAEARGLPAPMVPFVAPTGPRPAGGGAAPPPRPRRRGRWRWLVLASVLVLAAVVALSPDTMSGDNPQIELTVLSEEPDGSCEVRWTDPWDGRERTGPFACDPTRDPLLADWESAFVMSDGFWKGELYYWADGALHGPRAWGVLDGFGVGGTLVLLTGLVGGAVSLWLRRRPSGPVRVSFPAPAAVVPPAVARPVPTYERLAALAGHQPVPGPRRPEADVRSVPWWRVRTLRRVAGVPSVLGALGVCASMGGLALSGRDDFNPAQVYVTGALGAAAFLFHGFRLLTSGRPTALLLARAATAPVPVVRRYALLHDPHGGPVLVLFPAHGGPDDLPEAVLPLTPPGTLRKPRLGLPPAPTGTVELRGWLDRADDGRPIVVAWIGDRPLWPTDPYGEAGTAEAASLLDRLAPLIELPEETGSAAP